MTDIVLASKSPRRAELLDQINISYRTEAVDINEDPRLQETPEKLVVRLAEEKSQAVKDAKIPVLGADTLGIINDELLIKPIDFSHSQAMLRKMSGQWHEIYTAVSISHSGITKTILNKNRVLFRLISDEEIHAYWNTNEPKDKAGSYAIQGLAASFIERIEGSYSGIMGLPLFETSQLLKQFGISVIRNQK